MSKALKIFIGIFTFLPMILVIIAVFLGLYEILTLLFSPDPVNPFIFIPYLSYIFSFFFFYSLFYLLLGIFYLVHLIKNRQMDNEKKILWGIVLIAFSTFSMPAYWLIHIWKEPNEPEQLMSTDYDAPGAES